VGGLTLNKDQFDITKHKPWKLGSHQPLKETSTSVQPATPSIKHEPEAPKKGANKRLRVNAKGTGTNTGGT
jgi:hypothetical protein